MSLAISDTSIMFITRTQDEFSIPTPALPSFIPSPSTALLQQRHKQHTPRHTTNITTLRHFILLRFLRDTTLVHILGLVLVILPLTFLAEAA